MSLMMSELTPERLAEIKARTDAATPGPWFVEHLERDGFTYFSTDIAPLESFDGEVHAGVLDEDEAEFIAHAREDVPDLVAEVERLRSERDALQAKLDQVREWAEDNDVTLRRISGEPIHTMAVLLAILDGEENN